MIPVVPFLCIFAGYGVSEFSAAVAGWLRARRAVIAAVCGVAVIAPSALSVVRFDRLLAKEDSRVIAARWIQEQIPSGSSIYMSGNLYGHPQFERAAGYQVFGYDRDARTFTADKRKVGLLPDWIVVQRSALPYSHIPPAVVVLLPKQVRVGARHPRGGPAGA